MNKKKWYSSLTYIVFDIMLILMAYMIALTFLRLMRYNYNYVNLPKAIIIVVTFKIIAFYILGVYKMMVEFLDYRGIFLISLVIFITNLIIVGIMFIFELSFIPKTMYIFITPIEVLLLVGYRLIRRFSRYFDVYRNRQKNSRKRTLIIGAGSAAQLVLKELETNKDYNNYVVGFLDDDKEKYGQTMAGKSVLGIIEDLDDIVREFRVEEVIIAIKDYSIPKLNALYNKINNYENVSVKKISIFDSPNSSINIVNINVEDLLNRDEISLDSKEIYEFIKDEVVLVTGGGGSIGSELCRQIFALDPRELIIFDIYENNAYEIEMELKRIKFKNPRIKTTITTLIGSVYNEKRLEEVFDKYRPTIVFHAAAYKHVPLMEESPREAIRTNVIGTNNTAKLACKYNVRKMVLVSSDKAVRSTNVMGATKRFAELIIDYYNKKGKTNFSAVRFGNVLGSNGSVIPLFKKQIEDGGPITVTHKEITRYFMTIPESVGLILQCAVYAKGGEIFILDMGEPVKIYDLAVKMIKLMGYRPNIDINIEIVGLRPGEKLYEELLVDPNSNDNMETDHSRIYIEKNGNINYSSLDLDYVIANYEILDNASIKTMLSRIIKTYKIDGDNNANT